MPRLERDGATIRFDDEGTGEPVVVFVHGLTCTRHDWRLQVPVFTRSHRVLACDLRGHGDSTGAPETLQPATLGADVAGLLEHCGIERAVLVGHSMGCRVVTEAALAAPDRVIGVVFADGSRQADGDPEAALSALRAQIDDHGGFAGMASMMFEQMFVDGCNTDGREAIIDRALSMPDAAGRALLEGMIAWDATRVDGALEGLSMPVLALQSTSVDTERRRVPMSAGDTSPWTDVVLGRCADATVEVIADVGHFNMLDAPDAFNEALVRFIDRVAGQA